jgi:hypothetical protein
LVSKGHRQSRAGVPTILPLSAVTSQMLSLKIDNYKFAVKKIINLPIQCHKFTLNIGHNFLLLPF